MKTGKFILLTALILLISLSCETSLPLESSSFNDADILTPEVNEADFSDDLTGLEKSHLNAYEPDEILEWKRGNGMRSGFNSRNGMAIEDSLHSDLNP
ncbi:MAG: hypothetical protein H8D46_04630 [FCB group bacterium]|nr:hypothetical protein [FCB group bacterium]